MRRMGEATTTPKMDYFRMPRPLWRKLKKYLPKPRKRESAKGGRPRASERAVADAQIGTCFGQDANGRLSIAIGSGSPQASSTNVSREVERGGHIREAQEEDSRVLCQGARRDRLEVAGDGHRGGGRRWQPQGTCHSGTRKYRPICV